MTATAATTAPVTSDAADRRRRTPASLVYAFTRLTTRQQLLSPA